MSGIGLHFSLRDLWLVRDIAVPGAIVQMVLATAIGYRMAINWGWSPQAALVLGVAISVASTVVLLRGLMDLGALQTPHGRVAVGWLVLEDLATSPFWCCCRRWCPASSRCSGAVARGRCHTARAD
jgi:CPA2 family monovalent cation:H+ antiporter-2